MYYYVCIYNNDSNDSNVFYSAVYENADVYIIYIYAHTLYAIVYHVFHVFSLDAGRFRECFYRVADGSRRGGRR